MAALVLLVLGGVCVIGVILGARWWDLGQWRRSLAAFQMHLPRGLTVDEVASWLDVVTAGQALSRWRLLSWPSLVIEVEATQQGVSHYVLVAESARAELLAAIRSALPRVRLEEAADYLAGRPELTAAVELRLSGGDRLLAHDRAASAAAALLAATQPLGMNEVVRTQWIVGKLPARRSARPGESRADSSERERAGVPLVRMVGRVGAVAGSRGRAWSLVRRVTGTWRVLDAPGVAIVRRTLWPGEAGRRLVERAVPLSVWPVVVNVRETVGLVGLPVGELHLPGLTLGAARQLPPAVTMPTRGLVLATSNYPGMTGRPLALATQDRLRHLHIEGPTGTGKSTLIANMILQDMAAGDGLAAFDPKGDVITDVLDRASEERASDTVVIDASETDQPVGFNPLAVDGLGEHERELAVDRILHVLKEIYSSYWGPRTDDVLRAALLTLVNSKGMDGSAFTLVEVPELLTNAGLRAHVLRQPNLPPALREYWRWYESLSEGEQLQMIGAPLNKLRAFTMRSSLRLLLGQSRGLNLADIFTKRRVLLVSLAKGKLGTETSNLLGALLMASLWQATLGRVAVPAERRRPTWCYVDEFQDLIRFSSELGEMLAQARGLGLGMILAHQYLDQLPKPIRSAVLGTARSQLVFQLGLEDAQTLAKHYAPALAADDLRGLRAHEIALRACLNGQTIEPVTGITAPLGAPARDGAALAAASRERWGRPRAEVEAELVARVHVPEASQWGRRIEPGSAA